MVAVPEMSVSAPVAMGTGRSTVPAQRRRVVAVAVSPMELLRSGSDLVRLVEDFPYVDLLVAAEDLPAAAPGPLGVLSYAEDGREAPGDGDLDGIDLDHDDVGDEDEDEDDPDDEVRERLDRLGIPELHLHRLGLRPPLTPLAEADLVAALSELVGFDPEPGVYCLAPALASSDPSRTVVSRAAQRIAQVYGLPLLRYRCHELSVVDAS